MSFWASRRRSGFLEIQYLFESHKTFERVKFGRFQKNFFLSFSIFGRILLQQSLWSRLFCRNVADVVFFFSSSCHSSQLGNSSSEGPCVMVGSGLYPPTPQITEKLWVHSKVIGFMTFLLFALLFCFSSPLFFPFATSSWLPSFFQASLIFLFMLLSPLLPILPTLTLLFIPLVLLFVCPVCGMYLCGQTDVDLRLFSGLRSFIWKTCIQTQLSTKSLTNTDLWLHLQRVNRKNEADLLTEVRKCFHECWPLTSVCGSPVVPSWRATWASPSNSG